MIMRRRCAATALVLGLTLTACTTPEAAPPGPVATSGSASSTTSTPAPPATGSPATTRSPGTPTPTGPTGAAPSYLFVQEASSGRFTPTGDGQFELSLSGVAPGTIYFAERPTVDAGSLTTDEFVRGFAWTPVAPNVAIVLRDGAEESDVIVATVDRPTYDAAAGTLTYRVEPTGRADGTGLEDFVGRHDARLPASFGDVAVFIDDGTLDRCAGGIAAGSQIRLADGTARPVDSLTAGATVRTTDGRTAAVRTVLDESPADGVYEIVTASGRRLTASGRSCVITPEGLRPVAELAAGIDVVSEEGPDVVTSVTTVAATGSVAAVVLEPAASGAPGVLYADGLAVETRNGLTDPGS